MTTDAFGLQGQWRKSERNTTPAPQIITKIWQKHQMLSLHFPHSIYSTIPYIETQHSIMIEIYIYICGTPQSRSCTWAFAWANESLLYESKPAHVTCMARDSLFGNCLSIYKNHLFHTFHHFALFDPWINRPAIAYVSTLGRSYLAPPFGSLVLPANRVPPAVGI